MLVNYSDKLQLYIIFFKNSNNCLCLAAYNINQKLYSFVIITGLIISLNQPLPTLLP